MTKKELDELTFKIIGAAIEVHRILGPGLLESVYHVCLAREFDLRGIKYSSELSVPILFKDVQVNSPLRCDFLVENSIVLELKSVDNFIPIYDATLLSYMQLLQKPKGIIINFNCINIFKEGQKTFVNELYRELE